MNKPSILDVIGRYVDLRRVGRQWRGLCPFHAEKTPSFYVDEKKGFHCFGCQEHGDVITFIEKIEGVTFREACARLGLRHEYTPKPKDARKQRAAALLAGWLNQQYLLLGGHLRELSAQIALADEIPDPELKESLEREWEILSDLHDDLQRSEYAAELFRAKDSIERIMEFALAEALLEFPEFTPEYRAFLQAHLPTKKKNEALC